MKQFYSCIDVTLITPQPEQHELSRRKAAKEGGHVVFYGAEEYRVHQLQPFILNKLSRTNGIDGVIFFSIDQFCYGERFNLRLLLDILHSKVGVHFAREDISYVTVDEVMQNFIVLSAYFHAFRRRRIIDAEEILRVLA